MKIVIIDNYKILHNDAGAPVFCNKRTPTMVPVPSRTVMGGGMDIATMQGAVHWCGDHCPFFKPNTEFMVELFCNTTEQFPIAIQPGNEKPKTNLQLT